MTPTTPRKPMARAGERFDFGADPDALMDDELWREVVLVFPVLPAQHRARIVWALRLVCAAPPSERVKIVRDIVEAIQAADVQDGIVAIA